LSTPIVIHLQRPYANEEEYLAQERFSIEAKSMLLIDQPALPLDTAVVFDVTLANGQKPIRAEARVIGYVEAAGNRPGGLRVRFRRFGAATKAFIDRAVNDTTDATLGAPPVSAKAPDAAAVVPPPAAAVESVQSAPSAPNATAAVLADSATPLHSQAPSPSHESSEAKETSGIHRKTAARVEAPANREALLERLRKRRLG